MKVLISCVVLALAVVAASAGELHPAMDVSEDLEGETELAGDSPVRQSQRERQDERAVKRAALDADAAEANGVSLIEGSAHVRSAAHGRSHSRGRSVPGPSLDRITGATKTYHPNDQMCVICQFLVQRVQLDMAHFNVIGGFVGAKTKGTGGAANAAAGGADAGEKDSSFLEIGSSFADSDEATDDWKSEDAESAKLMELAARQELAEANEDWDSVAALEAESHAVAAGDESADEEESDEDEEESEDESEDESEAEETSFSETAASTAVADGLSAEEHAEMEDVISEVRDERVADGVQKTIDEGMEVTPVLVEAESEAESDSDSDSESSEDKEFNNALGDALDKQIDLSADEKEDMGKMLHGEAENQFQNPTYNADGQSEALTGEDQIVEAETDSDEDAVLLQIGETESDEDEESASDEDEAEFEAEMDAEDAEAGMVDAVEFIEVEGNPSGLRSYARVLHVAEASPVAPVMAEMSGEHQHFTSAGGLAVVNRRHRRNPNGVGVANSPRRFRLADALSGRPRWNRFDPTVQPHPNAQRAQAREMWHRLMQMTYDRLEGYCSTRLPEQFTPFCRPMLRRFRVIAEGIRYGDRPNQICMRTRFCPRGSYVRRSPHNVFKHVA